MNRSIEKLSKELKKNFKGSYKFDESLCKHTTFRIGGPAAFWTEPKNIEDLKLLSKLINKLKLPFFILGRGSNVLIKDKGFVGVVIHLNCSDCKKITFEKPRDGKVMIEAGAAVTIKTLLNFCIRHSFSGLEFMSGIPGSLGGALAMNAGIACNLNIGSLVQEVKVMNKQGKIISLNKKRLRWGYRYSNLSKYMILSVKLKFKKARKIIIAKKCRDLLKSRWDLQEIKFPSAGCIFRNPSKGLSAGRLIDLSGLKGKRIRKAQVSRRHANFIINLGGASAGDVLGLMKLIRKKVKKDFAINLTPEVKII